MVCRALRVLFVVMLCGGSTGCRLVTLIATESSEERRPDDGQNIGSGSSDVRDDEDESESSDGWDDEDESESSDGWDDED